LITFEANKFFEAPVAVLKFGLSLKPNQHWVYFYVICNPAYHKENNFKKAIQE